MPADYILLYLGNVRCRPKCEHASITFLFSAALRNLVLIDHEKVIMKVPIVVDWQVLRIPVQTFAIAFIIMGTTRCASKRIA